MVLTMNAKREIKRDAYRDSVLSHIYSYAETFDTTGFQKIENYTYTKFQIKTNKRNATLLAVPTMYAIAHGVGRTFFSETYSKTTIPEMGKMENRLMLNVSTIPHRRRTMPSMLKYMTPEIYQPTMIDDNIFSPFHRENHKFYRYYVTPLAFDKAQVLAYPRLHNTQLVTTRALVNAKTGHVESVDLEGEYDMTRFFVSIRMGDEDTGFKALLPQQCHMRIHFRFLGNKIRASYTSIYDLPAMIPDTLENVADTAYMAKVRPIDLTKEEQSIYENFFENKRRTDSINAVTQKKPNYIKEILWDAIGDNILNRIKQNFGKQRQGYLRINPILNPLYMGYSHRKGFVYKFDTRFSYTFNEDIALALRVKAGYSFKQKQLYVNIPATFKYNQEHNGYLQVEFGNGNRITTNRVARYILGINETTDTIAYTSELGEIRDFKDNYLRVINHWNFHRRVGFEVGLITHKRDAVHPQFYLDHGYPASYRSAAPCIALDWQPWGRKGPFLKLDYERGIKGLMGANIDYERFEFDAQSILFASRRQSFSLRFGGGFYTKRGRHWYFVDYTNFRDNNLPGGWNDDWSGEFELLSSSWYNASEYYVRSNATYESPMLVAAWLPLVGRFLERERIYVNTLLVKHLHPYTEWGYGFTTRLVSLGFFAAFQNRKFDGVGCKFSFELFRDW